MEAMKQKGTEEYGPELLQRVYKKLIRNAQGLEDPEDNGNV